MADIANTDDIIDIRDVIARVEELRSECETLTDAVEESKQCVAFHHSDENATGDYPEIAERDESIERLEDWQGAHADELAELEALLAECKGNGGDEQWEGDWYPLMLIRDSYFETYAKELAEDTGAINPAATWPNNCIDWERATRELQRDYTSVEFDGETYWTR